MSCELSEVRLAWGVGLEMLLERVRAERVAQVSKWGLQVHDQGTWFRILGEEVGEVAKASLECGDLHGELIQVAAVALAWAQQVSSDDEGV